MARDNNELDALLASFPPTWTELEGGTNRPLLTRRGRDAIAVQQLQVLRRMEEHLEQLAAGLPEVPAGRVRHTTK